MKKLAILVVAATTVFIVTGCNDDKASAPEEVQSVEWYKEHKAEREDTVTNCRKIPTAQIGSNQNCVNAIRARDFVSLSAKRLQLEPLTKEQLKAGGIGEKQTHSGDTK